MLNRVLKPGLNSNHRVSEVQIGITAWPCHPDKAIGGVHFQDASSTSDSASRGAGGKGFDELKSLGREVQDPLDTAAWVIALLARIEHAVSPEDSSLAWENRK